MNTMTSAELENLRNLWQQALREDGTESDVTSLICADRQIRASALLNARQAGVFAGKVLLDMIGELHHDHLAVTSRLADGSSILSGTTIAELTGTLHLLMGIERTMLNFLERLCGVATLTGRFVNAVAGTGARIYDTRKTLPGWRWLDKYAVRCGGGVNHRMGLHDAVLVKDNHLAMIPLDQLATAATAMIQRAMNLPRRPDFIEFEVDTLAQFDELLKVPGVDVILLDNFKPDQMREAVRRRNDAGLARKLQLEASGGISLATVRDIALTGVDRISIGILTHSAPALDIGMDIHPKLW